MTVASMTGFAHASGAVPPFRWAWEVKTVNAKGLDLRLRLPPGFDGIEQPARARLNKALVRGACYVTLSATREAASPVVRLNHSVLASLIAAVKSISLDGNLRPPSLDGLLNVRGVVEVVDAADDESVLAAAGAGALDSLDEAIKALLAMRHHEGQALGHIVAARLAAIERLTGAAEICPARKPEAIRMRLIESIGMLTGASPALDPNRLHQEAMLLATKSDVREELDRLKTHVTAARQLIASGGPIGRRLDFLAQEFGREANTLCSKSNDAGLTTIGLELKAEIEQFREQVQNIE